MARYDRERPPSTVSFPRDVCVTGRTRVRLSDVTRHDMPKSCLTINLCVTVDVLTVHRQQDLFRVLKAYTLYRPEEGYCQAQAPIAAVLLMHMPAEVTLHKLLCLAVELLLV